MTKDNRHANQSTNLCFLLSILSVSTSLALAQTRSSSEKQAPNPVTDSQDQKPVVAENLEFRVLAVTRVQEWIIPGSEKMPNGPFRIQAKSGYEVAIIRLKVKRLESAAKGIETASASLHDSAGNEYRANYFPDKVGTVDEHEAVFAFNIPTGTKLAKIQLTPAVGIELK